MVGVGWRKRIRQNSGREVAELNGGCTPGTQKKLLGGKKYLNSITLHEKVRHTGMEKSHGSHGELRGKRKWVQTTPSSVLIKK